MIWYFLHRQGVTEAYIEFVKAAYRNCTSVKTYVGVTEKVEIEVGLHQGSAVSPFLLIVTMDTIIEEMKEETLFADDLLTCDRKTNAAETQLEKWRQHMEFGLMVSRTKAD